jgi:hypothetical protein
MFGDNAHEVLPNLWVGDATAAPLALPAGMAVLCVLENPSVTGANHIPILLPPSGQMWTGQPIAYRARLEQASLWISAQQASGKAMLVHCGAGVERSPLTVAWFMRKTYGVTLDRAYAWLQRIRPVIGDRQGWIER